MDYSPHILKKTKRFMIYMNGYRVLRYELKGLCYFVLAVLLVLLWQTFFQDNLFRLDAWLYLLITVLLVPFLHCYFRPIRLMAVIKFLDNQLKLQQRLETFFENLEKRDEVIDLQRQDTFFSLNTFDTAFVVKFRWPFEAKVMPFILFFIFLLFACKGLFDTKSRFITGLDYVKKEEISYQIVQNPFNKRSHEFSDRKKYSPIRENKSKTRKIFKTSAGNTTGLTGLKISEISKTQSKSNSSDNKTTKDENQHREVTSIKNSQTDKLKTDTPSHSDKKILHNPSGNIDTDILKKRRINELTAKPKPDASAISEADVAKVESSLIKKAGGSNISRINNMKTANDNGSAETGSSSYNDDVVVRRPILLQNSFIVDPGQIEEMISKNSVEPSLREYVKKYFLSLDRSSDVSE